MRLTRPLLSALFRSHPAVRISSPNPHRPLLSSVCALAALALLLPPAGDALAQAYPGKSIRLVVGYTPGGFTDTMARAVGDKLGPALGQSVLVENKPGANSIIGADAVAKAAPDGYTLGMVIAAYSVNATLYAGKLPYDTQKDLVPVSLVGVSPLILVANNNFPVKNAAELIAYAKANPGKVNYGSSGVGAAAHLGMEYLMSMTGTKMVHAPYKGTAPALTDLMGGQIQVMFDAPSSMLAHVKGGKIKALAMASDKRMPFAQDIPTIAESGVPGYAYGTWALLLAPAATPREIVGKLSAETAKLLRTPEMREKFAGLGVEPVGNTPEEAAAFLKAEIEKSGKIVREAGVKAEN
jgi:tripartite-type tricarboxylate transporter receptor subunit TctC